MPRKKDITRAEAKALRQSGTAPKTKRDELLTLHHAMVRDALRLTDEERLETWETIASVAASMTLAKMVDGDMSGTSALAEVARRAREEIDGLRAKLVETASAGRPVIIPGFDPSLLFFGAQKPPDA